MEIVLNLVWLSISAALLIACGARVARASDDRTRLMAAIALVCLICLLFPVISMTDDLNSSGPALVEPSKLKKLVASAHVVLTLLPWPALQAPQENRWAALDRMPDVRRPSQEIFAFNLSRRPPPRQPALS